MFTSAPMQHVTLYMVKEDAPVVALILAESGVFDPVASSYQQQEIQALMPEQEGQQSREMYHLARSRLQKILDYLQISIKVNLAELNPIDEAELTQLNLHLGEIWRDCSECEVLKRHLEEERGLLNQLEKALENYAHLDIDLGLLQGDLQFLDIRIGLLPNENIYRIKASLAIEGYFLLTFRANKESTHVVVAGLRQADDKSIDSVLEAASFHHLTLPSEFHDHPQKVEAELNHRRQKVGQLEKDFALQLVEKQQCYDQSLIQAAHKIALAKPYAVLSEYLQNKGSLTRLTGWTPTSCIVSIKQQLEQKLPRRIVIETRDPEPDAHQAPTAMHHPKWLKPFVKLVKIYGIPRYGEIDPTWLFTLSYILMFGMMFGDVGHGLLIAVGGWSVRAKISGFAPLFIAAGISSAGFGFFYGSLFGYEDMIQPIWMSPLHDPQQMLMLAFYWGIGFILVATLITIRNRLAEQQYRKALFDSRGIAGVVLYLGLIFVTFRAINSQFGVFDLGMIGIPLAVIMAEKWRESESPTGEKILIITIESFENMMSYITSTLSFLRVAAFSLNHVALAVAVFTLAAMMETAGYWLTVIVGNLFILILEGAIVAIQVLRLEYYEGFSRFYSGDGRAFKPIKLNLKF